MRSSEIEVRTLEEASEYYFVNRLLYGYINFDIPSVNLTIEINREERYIALESVCLLGEYNCGYIDHRGEKIDFDGLVNRLFTLVDNYSDTRSDDYRDDWFDLIIDTFDEYGIEESLAIRGGSLQFRQLVSLDF